MREPEHLRLTAAAAEATAAATALALTDGLMRPTNDRAGVAERLATLSVQRDAVGHLVLQMRRLVGPPCMTAARRGAPSPHRNICATCGCGCRCGTGR